MKNSFVLFFFSIFSPRKRSCAPIIHPKVSKSWFVVVLSILKNVRRIGWNVSKFNHSMTKLGNVWLNWLVQRNIVVELVVYFDLIRSMTSIIALKISSMISFNHSCTMSCCTAIRGLSSPMVRLDQVDRWFPGRQMQRVQLDSGKSWTMAGCPCQSEHGLIANGIEYLFNLIREHESSSDQKDEEFSVQCAYIESKRIVTLNFLHHRDWSLQRGVARFTFASYIVKSSIEFITSRTAWKSAFIWRLYRQFNLEICFLHWNVSETQAPRRFSTNNGFNTNESRFLSIPYNVFLGHSISTQAFEETTSSRKIKFCWFG